MFFNYDELYSRYIAFVHNGDGSQSDLIDRLEGDFENWDDSDCDKSDLTALRGRYTHDEAVWMYKQLLSSAP